MMRARTTCLAILGLTGLAASCSSVSGEPARDFELYFEDSELDALRFEEEDNLLPDFDARIERERVGARFAWGSRSVRGFFQVFGEEWQSNSAEPIDLFGLGGGAMGTPVLTDLGKDVDLILPWRGDISGAAGSDSVGPIDRALVYLELHLDIGIGIDWKGLRPSVGIALSSIGGTLAHEAVGSDLTYTMAGANAGGFLDVQYKHADFPLYGHLRLQGGDYESAILGVGARF